MKTKQQLFEELTSHLLQDEYPSSYLNKISENSEVRVFPFTLILDMKKTEQASKYHPEGNVWNHTMLVVDEAAKVRKRSANPLVFMWAALLHDIGKPSTTKIRKGRITSYDHDKVGANLAVEFLEELTTDMDLTHDVSALVRWHMQILFILNDLPFQDIEAMKQDTDVSEVALLSWCDRMGRIGAKPKEEEENIQAFLQKCRYRQI